MIDLSFLTAKDLATLAEKGTFTREQKFILRHLYLQDMTDEGVMNELRLSRNNYYKIKTDLLNKIILIAARS